MLDRKNDAAQSRRPDAGFREPLGQWVTAPDADTIEQHATRHTTTLVDAAVALGFVNETTAYEAFARWQGRSFADLQAVPPAPTAARLLPERVARAHQIIPLAHDNRTFTYASSGMFDDEIDRDVAFASGRRPQMVVAARSQLLAVLNETYRMSSVIDQLIDRIALTHMEAPVGSAPPPGEGDSPIVDLCNRIIASAVAAGASDVHLEPGPVGAVVRQRVCGILEPLLTLPASAVRGVTNRFKLVAKTDITVKMRPQDGAFRVVANDQVVDVRLSTVPTIHGEKIVMRVIPGAGLLHTVDTLGYDRRSEQALLGALSKSDGLVLVTGPTGSGKTTVLYAALQFLRTGRVNIVTVEDPVERQLEGVSQIAVNTKTGTSFANVLRSVMRQDPNVIMVGEIRDNEVAEIVGQAAYTGHLVLSSLHTIDAASAITRLVNLGLQPFKIAESLNAVIAQRLVRKLCPQCAVVHDEPTAHRLGASHGVSRVGASTGRGCSRCKQTGFEGRVAVPEILVPDDALRVAIRDGAGASQIRAAMAAAGHPSMREFGLQLVARGITSIDEVNRVLADRDGDAAVTSAHPASAQAPATAETAAPRLVTSRPIESRSVLVADDDRMIRLVVRMLLEKHGFKVLEAANGSIAMELARRETPDLMLVDLQMPDMDGFQVLEMVRGDQALRATPVLVLTAETGSDIETKVLEMGADDYVNKPFEPEVLMSRVRAAFRRASRAA